MISIKILDEYQKNFTSRRAMARALGVSHGMLNSIYKGRQTIDLDLLITICERLEKNDIEQKKIILDALAIKYHKSIKAKKIIIEILCSINKKGA